MCQTKEMNETDYNTCAIPLKADEPPFLSVFLPHTDAHENADSHATSSSVHHVKGVVRNCSGLVEAMQHRTFPVKPASCFFAACGHTHYSQLSLSLSLSHRLPILLPLSVSFFYVRFTETLPHQRGKKGKEGWRKNGGALVVGVRNRTQSSYTPSER